MLKNSEIVFELTNKCAYHCTICPREKMTRDQGVMSMELYQKIIDEAIPKGLKYVTLLGFGEPMLDKYFVERVKYAKEKGLFVSTDTTGYLLKESIAKELINLKMDSMRFSCFSTTKEVYYKLHNLDTFDLAVTRINKLLEIKKELKSEYPKTGIYFVRQELNKNQTQDFINYWKDKVDEVNVWEAHNWIDSFDLRNKGYKRKKTCGRPNNGPLQVRYDGKVSACCFDFNTQLITGDLSKQSIDEMKNNSKNINLQKAHNSGDMSDFSICDNCDQMYDVPDTLIYTNAKDNKVGTSGNTYLPFDDVSHKDTNEVTSKT
jgi:radical SAM protein with 4Fe4S-binding SPASM domain